MAERPVAVITGTSRDVGKYISYGLAQAGFDILGLYRNPQHDQDQANVISEAKGNKVRMIAVRTDLLDEDTPDLILDRINEDFGGKIKVFIDNAAGGYGQTIEQARKINVNAPQRLIDRLKDNLASDAVIVFNTSIPAHLYKILQEGEMELMGDYHPVAQSKNERELSLRSEFAGEGPRLAVVVGNGLEGSFVTRLLKGKNKDFVSKMLDISAEGYFPTMMDMATAVVRVVRGNYPTGHTEYVGVKPEFQLYPGSPVMRPDSILSRDEIYRIIPHRWPFMFIGGVSELIPGERAAGWLADLTHPDINWTAGHFPGYQLVPGAITQEALEQLGALTVLSMPEYKGMTAVLTGVDGMRFKRQITPGEDVKLEAERMEIRKLGKIISGSGHVRALNSVNKVSVEGDVSFALINVTKTSFK